MEISTEAILGLTNFSVFLDPELSSSVKRQSIPVIDFLGMLMCSFMTESLGFDIVTNECVTLVVVAKSPRYCNRISAQEA